MNFIRDCVSTTILLLLVVGFSITNGNEDAGSLEVDRRIPTIYDYRLPKTIIPYHYEILLAPRMEDDFSFSGTVEIKATVQEPTNKITFHHGNVNITFLTVTTTIDKPYLSTNYNNRTEKYEITLREVLSKGTNISINMKYVGKLRDDMIGFYKSSYVDSAGKIRWMASTQFQTAHARHAFPCFDEPSFKATFTIRILRPKEYACLSNMPLNESVAYEYKYWDEFKQSIPMSTYLVAFTISDFKALTTGNFSVWARPEAIDQAAYALEIGPRGLNYLSKYFKQPYQLPKMDMVAVPDFDAGAMENWGLITYRETRMLYDEESSSDATKQSVASVILHELTHMWFGNQVTPEWWSYLWLSEAFARYFQYFGTAQVEKEWNMEEQFVVEQHQTGFAADGLETSNPMSRVVNNSQQLSTAGDTITYNKGGSIVRMMNLIFGSDVFDATLQNYLKNNKEAKVATPENLWLELQDQVNIRKVPLDAPVNKIMNTWTAQAGFPVLNVTIDRYGNVELQQKRFLLRNLKSTPTNLTWWIPITWTSQENPNFSDTKPKHWLKKENGIINIGNTFGWVIFNVQSSGFYRVNYDDASWYRIIETLNSDNYKEIHVLNRAALIDDALNLARAGLLPYKTAFDCLNYLKFETNYLPFKSAFSGLVYLDQRLSGDPEIYQQFKDYVLSLIANIYENVGYFDRANDNRLTVLLRGELNKLACNYGHKGCIKTFTDIFKQWRLDNSTVIKPNQRPVVYCMGLKYGKKADWEFLRDRYITTNSANEQITILQALGCSSKAAILEKYLLSALKGFEESRIRKQDITTVFSSVYSRDMAGAEIVMNFVEKNLYQMKQYGVSFISSVLSSASQRFSTRQLVDQFKTLIERRQGEFEAILEPLNNSLQIAEYELWWFEKNKDAINTTITPDLNGQETIEYRLPETINPTAYYIWIETKVSESDKFLFTGSVAINATVLRKTQDIVLHSADLNIQNITVTVDGTDWNILHWRTETKYDFLIIKLEKELQRKQHMLIKLWFKGYLNKDMRGFYRSYYFDDSGNKRWLAATHMEPVAARKMFPCFDEPALKANFIIEVTLPQNYNAISNMVVQNIVGRDEGMKSILFEISPKMSTYLVALVISDFSAVKNVEDTYAVWARPNGIQDGQYALSVMEPLIKFYEKSLSMMYPLPKMDMVALPDFSSGAMENWGLLTYKERNLLYNKNRSTTSSKQSIINVISHEITHQWFGDLVSPLWWKYLWLNEGFARYFQYFGTASVEKEWSLESQFVVEQVHSALEADSSATIHAMTHDVYSPTQIRAIFDTISYGKGASVIRMIEKSFGSDVFYTALHNYLLEQAYKASTPEHLFEAFKNQIADKEIKDSIYDILNSWTAQPGAPVVSVTVEPGRLNLEQKRFILKPGKGVAIDYIWHIPITWTTLSKPNFSDTKPKYWLKQSNQAIDVPTNDLILLNVQQSGYYRTNYDVATWKRIIDFLKSNQRETIHEINRAALIDDLMNFGVAGLVDYDIVLSATQYLENETSYAPWRAFFNGLSYLHKHTQTRDAYDAFKRYADSLITSIYNKLGFEDKQTDNHVTKLFRSHVRSWACKLNVADCEKKALSYYQNYSTGDLHEIPANYISVIYCTVARKDPLEWNVLRHLYHSTTFALEKAIILQSLGCTTEKSSIETLLQDAITNDSDIRFEDSSSVFSYVLDGSPKGIEAVIEFVQKNYNKMVSYYGQASSANSIVSTIGRKIYTEDLYNQYTKLLTRLAEENETSSNTFISYKSNADYELKWADRYIPKLHEWFEKHYPSENYRLPTTFVPLNYNLSLSPYFEERNFTFAGRVQIKIRRARNEVSRIVINAYKLDIKDVTVYQKNADSSLQTLAVRSLLLNETTQTLSIFTMNFLRGNELIVDIDFIGKLNDNMQGFYRSYYKRNGQIIWLATTQFEPTYARQAFPCFDEPAMKATFNIHIERPINYVAHSNMPISKTYPVSNTSRVWEKFKETPKMATYSVAFVVSDFKPVRTSYDVVNVWGRPEIALNGDFAQITALRMLEYLAAETGHKYGLPKLDLIGIPDFNMGAMENWGLVTFREYGLFYNENITSARSMDYIITIIAHELSHMMYGNLVTCNWWEYIWLNEGFAEYMQWRLSDLFRSSFGYNDLFVVDELHPALQKDVSPSTHPMNNPVSKPSEISQAFDFITYGKSSSVIRMIHKAFSPEVFSNATYLYLQKHQYNATTPKHLWEAFDSAVNNSKALGDWEMSMETLMDGWTNKPGYPIVHAQFSNKTVTLIQKNSTTYKNSADFWIPITFTTSKNPDFSTTSTNLWLGGEPMDIHSPTAHEWFIVNVQQTGYYRVNYDSNSWSRLITALKAPNQSGIHVANRAQIIDDLFNLAQAGHVNYTTVINATVYLFDEDSYLPWKAFFNGWSYLSQQFEGKANYTLLQSYVQTLAMEVYYNLDFEERVRDTHQMQLNRELILTWMCKYENSNCTKKAIDLFDAWRSNFDSIPPNAKPAVYCTGIRHGNFDTWNFLWDQYLQANFATEKKVILTALGCTEDASILKRYINYALSLNYTSDIRKQDVSAALASVYNSGKIGVDVMLDFLLSDYNKVYEYYGNWESVGKLITTVAPRISTDDQIAKLNKLAETKDANLTSILPSVTKAFEIVKKNQQWYSKNSDEIIAALIRAKQQLPVSGTITVHASNIFSVTVLSILAYALSN